jgi:hypothetical protein
MKKGVHFTDDFTQFLKKPRSVSDWDIGRRELTQSQNEPASKRESRRDPVTG